MMLLLIGCVAPGPLASVNAALAADAVAEAEPGLRLLTAVAGTLAEACAADEIEGYAFNGGSAAALGVGTARVERADSAQTWYFDGVGLDGDVGTLQVGTDSARTSFTVSLPLGAGSLAATLAVSSCDASGARATLSGSGTWTTGGTVVELNVAGPDVVGLSFAPVTASVPSSGQLRASDEEAGWIIQLDDAAGVDTSAGGWTGLATGPDWESTVEVGWP